MANFVTGFTGSVNQVEDSLRSQFQGNAVAVVDYQALRVTPNTTGTRTVNVAGGVSWSHGVRAVLDPTSVSLDAVTVLNQTRWDAIVKRTDWNAKTVTVMAVKGTAAVNAQKLLPAGVQDKPGDVHDQVLALAQTTYNITVPTAVENRRLWANKTLSSDNLASLPLRPSLYGAEALVAGVRYRLGEDASSNLAWLLADGYQVSTGTAVLTTAAGFDASIQTIRGMYNPTTGDTQLDISLRHSGPDVGADGSHGNFADLLMATIQQPFRPDISLPTVGGYKGRTSTGAVFEFPFGGSLGTDGRLILESGTPGVDLPYQAPNANGTPVSSIRAHIRFTKEV